MRKKTLLVSFITFFLMACLQAQSAAAGAPVTDSADKSATMAEPEAPAPAPAGYGLLMFGNTFLPGSAQIAMGNTVEGILELSLSLPLIGIGQGLIWTYYLAPQNGVASPLLSGGYPYGQDSWYSSRGWMLELGLGLDAAGRAVAAYSSWTARREYVKRYGSGGATERESLGEIAAAPFLPKNFLSFETLPVVALVGLSSFPADGFARATGFFNADTQPLWGYQFPPAAALSLKAADALVVSFFSALARELLFRGLILEQDGLVASIGLSSSYSLLSLVIPSDSTGEILLRTASEAAYSWYAGALAMRSGRLGQAIALRYWCEVSSSVIGYLMDPTASPPLVAQISVRY